MVYISPGKHSIPSMIKQAGAELCQAQVKLKVIDGD